MTPLHDALDATVSGVIAWHALPESERVARAPWSSGVELSPQLDARFQRTRWGDWTHATSSVANERIWELLQGREELDLAGALQDGECFSPSDDRFTLDKGVVRRRGALRRKVLDWVPEAERFQRYLPLLDLAVVGSADPTKDLRGQVVEDVPIIGWVDALGIQRTPNDRMHVVRLQGDSMDGGLHPLVDGSWLVMELTEQVDSGTISAVQLCQQGIFTVVLKKLHIEGETRRLESSNPAYEDTILSEADVDELKVVARYIEELPTPRRTRKADPALLKKWLRGRFETPETPPDSPDLPPQLDGLSQLELTPKGLVWLLRLEPLPPFIDEIEVAGAPVSAERVRGRVGRLAAEPSTERYTLTAGPLTPLLAPFELHGLSADRATVFRFDTTGRALRKLGAQARVGERVRLLLPPGLDAPTIATAAWPLGQWTACELTVTRDLSPALGLSLATERVEAHWETAPQRWRRLSDGTRVPVFGADQEPILQVHGVAAAQTGEFVLTTTTATTSLPRGTRWSVAIEDLAPGEHGLEVTPADTEVVPLRRAFEVTTQPPPHWTGEVSVQPAGASDLREWRVEVSAPPLWTVRARWDGSRTVERTLCVEPHGRLPLEQIEIDTRTLRREPMGRLTLDFGELGAYAVDHVREERVTDIETGLDRYLDHAEGADPLLLEKLAERLLGTLGWVVQDRIVKRATLDDGQLCYRPEAVLVVAQAIDDEARDLADAACAKAGLDLAFVVAGRHWLRHAPCALFPAPTLDARTQRTDLLRTFHWRSR